MKAVFLGMRLDSAKGPKTESLEILAEKAFDAVVFNNFEGDKHEIPDLLVGRHIKTIQNFTLLVQFSSYMFYQFIFHFQSNQIICGFHHGV